MRTGALVNREPASRYAPIGVHGRPVSDAYVTLRAALLQRFGPAHAACFARPDRDPRDESIGWIAEVPGEPRRWTELPPDEQVRRSLDLEVYRADLLAYAAELRAAAAGPDTTAHGVAALLESALMVPDESHVHFVGDQPVLSFWGFRRSDGGSVAGLALAPPAEAPAAAPAAAPVIAAAAAVPWWRRLLWLLPLLLLLALLLLWLLWGQGCTVLAPLLPAEEGARPVTPVEPAPGVVPVIPGAPAGPGGVGAPGGADPGGAPAAPPQGMEPAAPPSSDPPPSEPPPSEPPKPEPPTPPAGAEPPPVPPPGPPLEIPPDAPRSGDVGFLDGEWRSQRGLVDNVTGEPLQQRYRFGKDGAGETIVRRSDGVECRAPARGRFEGGRLVLEEEGSLTCPDGRTYDRATTSCERTASGVTVCRGVNPDGSGYRVGLEKMP